MKPVLRFAGACALLFAGITSAQAETLKIATEGAYPPFNYVDSRTSCTALTWTSPRPCANR